jgi:hypothetical protein
MHESKRVEGECTMKKEDVWMIVLVGFSIIWVALFGMGVFG